MTNTPADAAPVGIGWRHAHYGDLLDQRPPLDFLEVHSENFFAEGGAALAVLRQGRAHYPVSLHGVGLALGSAVGIDDWHLNQLARLVELIEPIRVSDHACFARGHELGHHNSQPGHPDSQPVHAADLLPIPFNTASLDVLCANVQRVQDRLKRQLLVENLSAYISFSGSDRSEPEFLNALVQRTGCGLLVDVNNIYVNALNDQLAGRCPDPLAACTAWLSSITPSAVGELHLAGHINTGDMVIDDHGSRVCSAVWQLYRHAQNCFSGSVSSAKVPALIEWDTDVPALSVLLDEAALARRA